MPLDPNSKPPDGGNHPQPPWRKHFPIDADKELSGSRRQFIGGLTIAGGAITVGQVAIEQLAPLPSPDTPSKSGDEGNPIDRFKLEKCQSDMVDGEAVQFHYPNERTPCLLIRLSATEYVAFEQKCTHLACPVIPNVEENVFHCPCHHGKFDLTTGKPIAGPPRRPLRRLKVEFDSNDNIFVSSLS